MLDSGLSQPATERNEIVGGGDGDENQVGFFATDEIAARCYRCMASLNGLMMGWHVFADNHVNVFNLLHGSLLIRGKSVNDCLHLT